MNDQSIHPLTGESISLGLVGTAGDMTHDALLAQVAQQKRRIAALERILSRHPAGAGTEVVTITPKLKGLPKLSSAPQREDFRPPPWWPAKQEPSFALEPQAGRAPLSISGTASKVLAFAVFGLDGEALEREVGRIAREQLRQGDFVPVFLTDARDTDVFLRRNYVFEYFPRGARTPEDLDGLQPRLEFIENKWGVDLFINLGLPRSAWVRRETRPLEERYLIGKAHLLAGRYAQAKRVMAGFTEALHAQARVSRFGKPSPAPRASIVVVSHRDHTGVAAGLSSIAGQISVRNVEVILVDNGNGRLAEHGNALFRSFTLAEPGFNAGCSAARNLGAHHARAPYVIFLDDDGITAPGCVEALLRAIMETGAVAVRGCVRPLTSPELTGSHYDLGPARIPALNTTEGVSAWSRKDYVSAGGFDPLLAGHEGAELCSRLWRFHGPAGFIYEPSAVLFHDYAPSGGASSAKNQRYQANIGYLDSLGLRWKDINASQLRFVSDPMLGYLATRKPATARTGEAPSLSFITTAKNGRHFLAEYTQSLRQQTVTDFEVVFVDDHSSDGTLEEIGRLWEGDERLKAVRCEGVGRGAALNTALRHATGEICVIADVDDLSVRDRAAMTRGFFAAHPQMDCLSFVAFNESNPFRLGAPRSAFVDDLAVRQLFGMPASFPTFAFRRAEFPHRFDEQLAGGIDCDWLFRRAASRQIRGKVIFYPAVYYREHGGQITATKKEVQLAVRERAIVQAYEAVLGEVSDDDRALIHILSDTRQATQAVKAKLTRWVAGLLQANRGTRLYDPALLDQAMFEALREVRVTAG